MRDRAGLQSSNTQGSDRQFWLVGCAVLIGGLFVVHVMTYQTLRSQMAEQLETSRSELASVRADLKLLVDARRDAAEAGTLLAELKRQQRGVAAARQSLASLRRVNESLIAERERTAAAAASLQLMIALKAQIADEARDVPQAKRQLAELGDLKHDIEAEHCGIESAREHVAALLAISARLAAQGNTNAAARNLKRLLELPSRVNAETPKIGQAAQTLELLFDLNDEVADYAQSVKGMRKNLLEIILLETTVSRVARMMQPLVDLANLKRLSGDDVRAAARSILRHRKSRVARKNGYDAGSWAFPFEDPQPVPAPRN